MIKHFCDCCGREIDTVVGIDRYTISIPDGTEKEYAKGDAQWTVDVPARNRKEYELCIDCVKAFVHFVEQKSKEAK